MRQIVLDTETTGLEPEQGHRIIEIGCVEMVERRPTGNNFHQYLQPDRLIDAAAIEVHGITNEFLEDKPRFADISGDLVDYLRDAELIIHNAPFDVGFLNAELGRVAKFDALESYCSVLDTLVMARRMHPGQRNSLDALCTRYDVNNTHREKHGALLDAEILADVYLAMTGGQTSLSLDVDSKTGEAGQSQIIRHLPKDRAPVIIRRANDAELAAHEARLAAIDAASGGNTVWRTVGV
jgi:DNA polymerase-3 subunit epsilon